MIGKFYMIWNFLENRYCIEIQKQKILKLKKIRTIKQSTLNIELINLQEKLDKRWENKEKSLKISNLCRKSFINSKPLYIIVLNFIIFF